MSLSLKDQLIQAGLVSKKQAHEARRNKPKGRAAKKRQGQRDSARDQELAALDAHKREKDRALNAQRETQRKAREQAEWVRQLLGAHALKKQPPADDDAAFHFNMGKTVEHLYVGGEQRKSLAAGRLGIVSYDGQYHLLPREIVARIAERVPQRCWLPASDSQASAEDDPYAEFEVPDDLMW